MNVLAKSSSAIDPATVKRWRWNSYSNGTPHGHPTDNPVSVMNIQNYRSTNGWDNGYADILEFDEHGAVEVAPTCTSPAWCGRLRYGMDGPAGVNVYWIVGPLGPAVGCCGVCYAAKQPAKVAPKCAHRNAVCKGPTGDGIVMCGRCVDDARNAKVTPKVERKFAKDWKLSPRVGWMCTSLGCRSSGTRGIYEGERSQGACEAHAVELGVFESDLPPTRTNAAESNPRGTALAPVGLGASAPSVAPTPKRAWIAPADDRLQIDGAQYLVPAAFEFASRVAKLPDQFGTSRSLVERGNAHLRPRWR